MMIVGLGLAAASPTAEQVVGMARLDAVELGPDEVPWVRRVTPRRDPAATPGDGSVGGWSVDRTWFALRGDERVEQPGGPPRTAPGGGAELEVDGGTLVVRRGEEEQRIAVEGRPRQVTWGPRGARVWWVATPPDAEADAVRWASGGAYEPRGPTANGRLLRVDLDTGAIHAAWDGPEHVAGFAVHPDGERVALLLSDTDRYLDSRYHTRVALIHGEDVTELDRGGMKGTLTWSPDGESLAWSACAAGRLMDVLHVHRGGETRDVLAGRDLTVQGYRWTDRGLAVWTRDRMDTGLWLVREGRVKRGRLPGGVLRSPTLLRDGRTAYGILERPDQPGRLVRVDVKTGAVTELWDPAPSPGWEPHPVEVVRWTSGETELEGLLTVPRGELRGLVALPHGGPASTWDRGFSVWAQFLAGRGYAVFQPNFRGGIAYGRAFYEASAGRMAEVTHGDIESGVDRLLEDPRLSGVGLYYAGFSFGGYAAAWALGHTDRYRAFVAIAPIVSPVEQYVRSVNMGGTGPWLNGGTPWEARETWEASAPVRFLGGAATPTLILHGRDDSVAPLSHSLVLHRALLDQGVETRLVAYPQEGHGIWHPARHLDLLRRWAAWLDAH